MKICNFSYTLVISMAILTENSFAMTEVNGFCSSHINASIASAPVPIGAADTVHDIFMRMKEANHAPTALVVPGAPATAIFPVVWFVCEELGEDTVLTQGILEEIKKENSKYKGKTIKFDLAYELETTTGVKGQHAHKK